MDDCRRRTRHGRAGTHARTDRRTGSRPPSRSCRAGLWYHEVSVPGLPPGDALVRMGCPRPRPPRGRRLARPGSRPTGDEVATVAAMSRFGFGQTDRPVRPGGRDRRRAPASACSVEPMPVRVWPEPGCRLPSTGHGTGAASGARPPSAAADQGRRHRRRAATRCLKGRRRTVPARASVEDGPRHRGVNPHRKK
jgi:hypothetical protein